MVIKPEQMEKEVRAGMRGGKGACTVTQLAGKTLQRHCRLMAEILIPPCSSVGRHDHNGETEYYIVLEGAGTVDDDGVMVDVAPGDVIVTTGGAFHSVEATKHVDLRMIAVIVTDA